MAIEFEYIGWCNKTDADGTKHDKVWTAFKAGDNWYAGWGARGKSLSFKLHSSKFSLMTVKRKKEREYQTVDAFQLFVIFPDFEDVVDKRLMFATLCGKIK